MNVVDALILVFGIAFAGTVGIAYLLWRWW